MPKVVLVEPDPQLREWCRYHMESQQLTVLAFDDVRHTLEALRGGPPDVIIVATDLPGNGAFTIAAASRSNVRTALIPILFLVPANDSEAFANAVSIDPQGVITKPLTRSTLLEAVAARLVGASDPSHATPPRPYQRPGPGGPTPTSHAASGLMVDIREASVLVVVLRNFVSLARALSVKPLDALLRQFMLWAQNAIAEQGGWVVRADATGLVVLFEEMPKTDRTHATRALESALGVVLAARRTKKWGESELRDVVVPDLSVGCGVHMGDVVIARRSGGGQLAPTIAGQTAELAHRLDGRAKGLGWSVAASETALRSAGSRFQGGRRATLADTDHGVTLSIAEVLGFNPGAAKPGELPFMAEVKEAVVANTLLARLAGDVDQFTADQTILVSAKQATQAEFFPAIPERRIARRLGHGGYVSTYAAVHLPTDREEIVRVVRSSELPPGFVEMYLEEYSKLQDVEQRNVITIYQVGQTDGGGYVAAEFLGGGTLAEAIRKKLSVGAALNCLAQICLALDAVHEVGIIHGALLPEHFLFRQDRVLVLADFNVTERVSDFLGLAYPAAIALHRRRGSREDRSLLAPRVDFHAVGRIFYAMLTGESSLATQPGEGWHRETMFDATRLPLPLSPLQPCLDNLLGLDESQALERAEDVLTQLLTLKDLFPFDMRPVDADGAPRASEVRRR